MLFNVGAGKRTGEEEMSISNHESIAYPKCGCFLEYDSYHDRWYCSNRIEVKRSGIKYPMCIQRSKSIECKYSTSEDIFKGEFLNSGEDKQ